MLSHLLPVIHLQVSVSTFQCSSREENSPKISALTTCVPHRSRWWLHGDPIPLSGPAERRSFDWPGSRGPIEGFSWGNVKICWFPIRAVTSPLLTGMHFCDIIGSFCLSFAVFWQYQYPVSYTCFWIYVPPCSTPSFYHIPSHLYFLGITYHPSCVQYFDLRHNFDITYHEIQYTTANVVLSHKMLTPIITTFQFVTILGVDPCFRVHTRHPHIILVGGLEPFLFFHILGI